MWILFRTVWVTTRSTPRRGAARSPMGHAARPLTWQFTTASLADLLQRPEGRRPAIGIDPAQPHAPCPRRNLPPRPLAPHGQAVTAYRLDMPRSAFTEIADRVYVARYPQWDVNVGLVVGAAGALVIDTRSSAAAGAEVLRDVGRGCRPECGPPCRQHPRALRPHVRQHRLRGATIHAHDNVATALDAHAAWIKRAASADPGDAPEYGYTAADIADLLATPVRKPDATFTTSAVVDLGDRVALLRYAGRGHTDGDAAVLVPDSGVAFLGDLIEQSGPPSFGPDSLAPRVGGHPRGAPDDPRRGRRAGPRPRHCG